MTGRSRRPKWISLNFRSLDLVPRTFPFRGGGFTHERGGARIYEPLDGQRSDTRLPVTESLLSACTRRGADTMGRLQVHPVRYIKHEDGGGSVRIRGKITTTWISTLPAILPLLFSFSLPLRGRNGGSHLPGPNFISPIQLDRALLSEFEANL